MQPVEALAVRTRLSESHCRQPRVVETWDPRILGSLEISIQNSAELPAMYVEARDPRILECLEISIQILAELSAMYVCGSMGFTHSWLSRDLDTNFSLPAGSPAGASWLA
jgi:hypothetical protein